MDELSRYAKEPHDQITETNAALQYAVEELKTWLQNLEVRLVQLEKDKPMSKTTEIVITYPDQMIGPQGTTR